MVLIGVIPPPDASEKITSIISREVEDTLSISSSSFRSSYRSHRAAITFTSLFEPGLAAEINSRAESIKIRRSKSICR